MSLNYIWGELRTIPCWKNIVQFAICTLYILEIGRYFSSRVKLICQGMLYAKFSGIIRDLRGRIKMSVGVEKEGEIEVYERGAI